MAITYVNGDISTSDNVSTVTGVSWTGLGHAAGDIAFSIWALLATATTVVQDASLTTIEDHTDQNLRSFLSDRTMTGSESGTVSYTVDGASLNRMSVSLVIYRGVDSVGTAVRFTEGGTGVEKHPAANNLSVTPTADNALILLVYSERSSTGNTAGTLTPPTHVGTGNPSTIRKERGTGNSGGTYTCFAEFQLGTGTAGVAQTFTQWDATPDTLLASNADMWLVPLYPPAGTDATPTPSAVATVVSAPQAVASAGATQTPAATTATAGLPQATISANATVTPAAIVTAVSAPSSARNVGAAPGVLTATAALPQATPTTAGNATSTPAAIAGVVSVPAAVPVASSAANPAVTVTTVTLPQATPQAGVSRTPSAVTAVVSAPQATPSVSDIAAPAAVTAVVALAQVTVLAGGNVTATPAAIAVLVAFPQASPAGSALATPARILTTVGAPSAVPAVSDVAAPAAFATAVSLPAASRSGAAVATPGVIVTVVTVPSVTAGGPPAPYSPLIDPVVSLHANLAVVQLISNSAATTVRPNQAELT